MCERNLDFDKIIDRKNTNSLKYDCAKSRKKDDDLLPLWVADMDFMTSSFILDELQKRIAHGIFGYSEPNEKYFDAVIKWMSTHYDWQILKEWFVLTPGVVFALAMGVKAFTQKGDGVLIFTPVYYPFFEVVCNNDRVLIECELEKSGDTYSINYQLLEKLLQEKNVKLLLFCSPHNPIGRVWSYSELQKLCNICNKYGVKIISDEIHEDWSFFYHTPLSKIDDNVIVCTSPSKTFNLAGLQVSNIIIKNEQMRHAFGREIAKSGYSQLNTLGLFACEIAYSRGQIWLDSAKKYVYDNYLFLCDYLKRNLPKVKVTRLYATFLVWLDFSMYKISQRELEDMIEKKGKVWLDSGTMFGKNGVGCMRINIACPKRTLEKALQNIVSAMKKTSM